MNTMNKGFDTVSSKFIPEGIEIHKGEQSMTLSKEEYLSILQKGIQTGYIPSIIGSFNTASLRGSFLDVRV